MRRTIIFAVVFTIFPLIAFSQEQVFNLREIASYDYTLFSTKPVHYDGFFYLTFQKYRDQYVGAVRIDEESGEWYEFIRSSFPYSAEKGKLLLAVWDKPDGTRERELYKYDIKGQSIEKVSNGQGLFREVQYCKGLFFYYQNGLYYYARMKPGYEEASYNLAVYDENTGKISDFRESHLPVSLSPDKLLMILSNGSIWKLPENKVLFARTDADYRWDFTSTGGEIDKRAAICFITNNLLSGIREDGSDVRTLYTIDGYRIADVRFTVPGVNKRLNLQMTFSPDLTRAVASYTINWYSAGVSLLDTTPFRDWLREQNLLFRPTTAVSTESRVRVRENPNLEAQTLGHLEPGDELEVTDRSGVKVKIGEMTDWWYRIRRKSDGLEGWAYGAFLKLASYQGELGLRPEKDLR